MSDPDIILAIKAIIVTLLLEMKHALVPEIISSAAKNET